MTKKTKSTILQLIIFLGLGIGLIIWRFDAMSKAEKMEMFEAFKHVRYIWAFPILIIGFFSHFFRALRWKLLLRPLEIYPRTANVTFAVLIGYLVNTLVPRMGEVAKCTVLAKYEKVPADKMVGTIIAERAFDLVCLILILLTTLLLQYDIISPFANSLYEKLFLDDQGQFIWLRIVIAILIFIVGIAVLIKLTKSKKESKIGKIIGNILEGLRAIGKMKQKFLFFVYTLLIWGLYTSMVIIGFWAMPELENTPIIASLAVITFGSVGMIATPGGIGAYPVIVAQVLLLYGINVGFGTAYGWVSWAATTGIVLILGIISLILLPIYNRNK